MARWKRLAPYFIIGPVSGPLLAGVVINFQGRRFVLSALYAIALVGVAIELPIVVARLGIRLL